MKKVICLMLSVMFLYLCGCTARENKDTRFLLDTVVTLTAECNDEVLEGAFSLCADYEKLLSRTIKDSDVYKLNSTEGFIEVSSHTRKIIERSLYYSKETEGKFDITVCPVSKLWDFNEQIVPDKKEISEALKNVDYHLIKVKGNSVSVGNSQIDLGSIAKGYIADEIIRYFKENGVKSGIVNLGGNVAVFGKSYTVGIQDPRNTNEIAAKINDKKVIISLCNELDQVYVYWENYLLPANFLYLSEDEIGINIPAEAKCIKRSYIRAIAANKYGISNDILVPLEYGKVISDAKQITRFDKYADVLYSLMVDRFKDGKPENNKPMNRPDVHPKADYQGGDLAGITQVIKEGYFEKMGFTTIWMTPLNQNPLEPYGEQQEPVKTKFSGYHGYWPISSSKVDFRIGTEEELKELTKTAHEHGLNVILDYVANHVHQEHPMFKNDPTICTPLILPDGTRNIAQWNEHRLTTWFDDFLPTLNYDRKEIVETMTDSALYWIKNYDLDGFRHDACKHVQESFWRTLTYKIKTQVEIPEDKPFYQVGESYGSPQLISSYVNSGMLNGQFDFNTSDDASAVFALNSEDFHRVSNTLNTSLRVYGSHNLMGYISGNHDRGRFISYASGSLKYGEDAKYVGWQREVGVGDPAGYDKIVQLNAFNLTIPGVPVIYYGDEFGMPGANDPDCRRMMRFGDELNEKEQTTLESVAKLGQLRKNNLPLIYGDFIELYLTNTEWAYARNYFGEIVITVFNRNLEEKEIKIPLPKIMLNKNYETTFGSDFSIEDGILTIKVKANGVDVLTEK